MTLFRLRLLGQMVDGNRNLVTDIIKGGAVFARIAPSPGNELAMQTVLTKRLHLEHPIIQAPMAGGGDTPDLVAAVSNSGGIGFFGAAYLSPLQIAEFAETVRSKTSRP